MSGWLGVGGCVCMHGCARLHVMGEGEKSGFELTFD